jgi:hypothetical protein
MLIPYPFLVHPIILLFDLDIVLYPVHHLHYFIVYFVVDRYVLSLQAT